MIASASFRWSVVAVAVVAGGCGKRDMRSGDAAVDTNVAAEGGPASSPLAAHDGAAPFPADPASPPAPVTGSSGCSAASPCARKTACDAGTCPREAAWKIEELALGGTFACARYGSGRVWCARTDSRGAPAAEIEGVRNVARVVAGSGSHACVLAAGSVSCWGVGESGQLGNGELGSSPAPEGVRGLTDATAIAAGSSHTCAVKKSGAVVCWGKNADGQLGDGTKENRAEPVVVKGVTGAKSLSLGFRHSCATKTDGAVVCWGRDGGPNGEPRTIAGLARVDELAAMRTDTCARIGSAVWCFGGAFGREPTSVAALSGSLHIASDGYDLCGLRADGRASCFNPTRREAYDFDQGAESPGARLLAGGTCVVRKDDAVVCTALSGMGTKLEQL